MRTLCKTAQQPTWAGHAMPRTSGRQALLAQQSHLRLYGRYCRAPSVARRYTATKAFRQQRTGTALPKAPAADSQQGPTVLVPLDFYSCLGVTRTAGRETVRAALDRALLKRPEGYYSADTVALRDLLLRNAAECLLNYEKRREYDGSGLSASGYVVRVDEDHLPGALVLLQESGANTLVLDLGTQWLAANKQQDARSRDVTAALALAHHALAVQGLQDEGGCMLEACRHLESALLLTRQSIRSSEHAAAAADLQRDVLQLLKDYSPDYCLALLGLSLPDPQRPRGLLLLRKLLWELPEEVCPLGPGDRDDFLAAARHLLTAHEHLQLHRSAPRGSLSLAQQQLLAEATVAVAFSTRQPLLLLQAAGAFKQLEQAAAKAGVECDMCVERACVALLLGSPNQSLQELGLSAQGRHDDVRNPTQQAAREYVLAHCPQGSDLLSGLTALAQCWLAQGITGSFRQQEAATQQQQQQQQQGSPAGGLDLAPWFDSLAVRLVILVLTTLSRLRQCLQAVLGVPAAVAASFVWLQQQAAARGQAVQAAPAVRSGSTSTSSASSSSDAGTSSSSSSRESSSRHREIEGRNSSRMSPASISGGRTGGIVAAELPKHKKQQQQQQGTGQQLTPTPAVRKAAMPGAARGLSSTRQVQGVQASSQPPQADSTASSSSSRPGTAAAAAAAPVTAAEGPFAHSSTGRRAAHAGTAPGQASSSSSSAAATAVEGASLMARARAAAGREAPGDEGETGPEPSPAVRRRMSQDLSALEAQMWDTTPEPSGLRAAAGKALSLLLLGAALLVVVAGSRQSTASSNLPPGQSVLLFDARG